MSDQERIAVLEANQIRLQQDLLDVLKENREIREIIQKHMEREDLRWDEIHDVMTRWKGFVGGIIFVTSAIWAVILGFTHLVGKIKFGS